MEKLPEANLVNFISSLYGRARYGTTRYASSGHEEDFIFTALKKIFEGDDAVHIFQAAKGKCQFFLTLDKKTIIKRANRYEEVLRGLTPKLRYVGPRELVDILKRSQQGDRVGGP